MVTLVWLLCFAVVIALFFSEC